MSSDIRNFFGGKPSQSSQPKAPLPKATTTAKKSRSSRKVLEDSDDDGPKKPTPKKSAPPRRDPTPEGEETNASEYFGSSKPKKSAPLRSSATSRKPNAETPKASPAKGPTKTSKNTATPSTTTTPNSRTSSRKKAPVNYKEEKVDTVLALDDDDDEDDVFRAEFKSNGKGLADDYEEDEDLSDLEPRPRRVTTNKEHQWKNKVEEHDSRKTERVDVMDVDPVDDFVIPDDDEMIEVDKSAKQKNSAATLGKKRKSHEVEDEDDELMTPPKKARANKKDIPKNTPNKKKEKESDKPENAEMQAIFDSIPLVRPPTPPSAQPDAKKFKFGAVHANSGPPPAANSKEPPVGQENCLAGLSFVFTGLLQYLNREDAQNLVKRYGGKIVSAPSSKTSFVVLGSDAGPKKLETIAKFRIKTIDEDGLFELIRKLPANGGDSKAAAKNEEKMKVEMDKIKEMAAQIEKEERRTGGAGGAGLSSSTSAQKSSGAGVPDTRLWTVKYAPTSLGQICGNKQAVERLQRWLRAFPRMVKTGFKMAGPDGSGAFRAVIISGPPGIGKTTAAHLVAKLEGYDIVESNASETRSKKLVEGGLKGTLDTTSLLGYFAGDGKQIETSKKKLCLIMDEVDGMSAGDRGGVGALAAVCKKTEVPIILICNERKLPKMKPFDTCTFGIPFRRPTTEQIRSRIGTINYRENLNLPQNVLNALIEGTGADIRQVVNMISTIKTDQGVNHSAVDFDKSKQISKAWEKHVVLRPWDILGKILGGGMFSATSSASLNDKIELYFNDHELSSLMLAENYLGTAPIRAAQYFGKERNRMLLELAEAAANSISEGDLVDRLIHGPEQQWSLMPTHAVLSFVRPASYVAGSMAGHTSGFPAWLGKNSTSGKNVRSIKEIQGHMRLRASGDRHEIRQQYVPLLWSNLVKKLEREGKEGVPAVIDLMDSYFLTKDDWDAILELGIGPMDQDKVKIDSQTKATFTRLFVAQMQDLHAENANRSRYNAQNHPMPFMKASNVVAPKKTSKEKPDLEEALDESDENDFIDDVKDEDDDEAAGDITKDKYVKLGKKKKVVANGKKKATIDDSDQEDVEAKPKKGKGRAPAKGKTKN